jgi:pimeloyl-ACP methyl ester carboxylesterase
MNLIRKNLMIEGIPSILWGEGSDKLFIAVHGNMSRKDDDAIAVFAEEAVYKGYRVLSFDLPEHGDRADENYPCMVWNCVSDLSSVMSYARTLSDNISLFACSMGAYFSLLAYKDQPLEQALFLSPVLSMERIILNMMTWAGISEERLKTEKEIKTPAGETLYWDYYSYVKSNPVERWDVPTSILYGSDDNICQYDVISEFVKRFNCSLQVLEHGEHYFHTNEQLRYFREWVKGKIKN